MTYRYVNISGRPAQITADQTRTRARNIVPGIKSKTLHEINRPHEYTPDQMPTQSSRPGPKHGTDLREPENTGDWAK
tara:strand:+ start:261 stop:491 length:231 start_codon:yes stop_codon:yes gene_type:complete